MKWCSVSQIWSKPSSSVHSICSSSRWTTSSWLSPGAAWKKKKVPKRMDRRSYTGSAHSRSPVGAAELQDAIAHALGRLLRRHHRPQLRLRKHLAQIVRARGGMGGIVTGDDQGGHLHGEELLGLGAGWRLAIEQHVPARRHDAEVAIEILRLEGLGEGGVAHDHGGPRARLGILPERLALVGALDHAGEPVVAREAEVASEAVACVHLPAIAAHWPVKDQGVGRLGIARGESRGDRASHAAAEHKGLVDFQVLEELHALFGEEGPGEALHAAAR